uniref:Uncharacterized protein n=1 Tax=Timema poppense TaxID=170557 RepID=A0A7R9CSN3_TIMPO|nr:unnamed protein product [Timema poppensis]
MSVYIDNNGDAEGNYTVVALLEDTSDDGTVATWSMQPVGYFQYNTTTGAANLPVRATSLLLALGTTCLVYLVMTGERE